MGWWAKLRCWLTAHAWDIYRDPPRGYSICACDRCGQVSTPLGGRPTVWRTATFTETVFLKDNFKLVYPRNHRR